MIKVAHVTYDMRIGGTEMVIKNIIDSASTYFEMSIFCIEDELGPWGKELCQKGVNIASYQRKDGFDISVSLALRKFVKENGIDILHCHQYTPWVYGVLSALGLGVKVIFTEHGRFYPDYSSQKRRFINPLLSTRTQVITAISKATADALVSFEFLNSKRIKVIYNGITESRFECEEDVRAGLDITPDTIVLGTIARLDPIKNQNLMLRAIKKLQDDGVHAHLIIVGDGECRKQLSQTISDLGIAKRVTLTGYDPSPFKYLMSFDIFLLTSFSEGTSMTLLEAMREQKPCVVTNVGGNPEVVINNETGIVIESDSLDELTAAIRKLANDKALTKKMGHCGSERFTRNFSATQMVEQYESVYYELVR